MRMPINLVLALDFPRSRYVLDEAVALIHQIHLQLESIEDYRLKLKWWMGFVLAHTDRPNGSKAEIVESISGQLWSVHGIRASRTVLYQCLKLYRGLAGDYNKYLEWIEMKKRTLGRPVFWYDVVNDLLGGRSNPEVIGREAADEVDFRDAERGLEAIERIMIRAAKGNEEAAGVLEGIRQSVIGLMFLSAPPSETPRSVDYLRFVASHGCVACGQPSEPHHAVGRRGTGIKPSDFGCVPLCRRHHNQLHQNGLSAFERFHMISVIEAAFNLVHRYITGCWVTMSLAYYGPRACAMEAS